MTPNPPMTLEELYARLRQRRRPPREVAEARSRVRALPLRPRNDNAPPDLIA